MEQNEILLKTDDISVFYGPIGAVRNACLEIYKNETVGLIGANGAGKSTVMKAILGISRCLSGTVTYMGKDITRTPTPEIVSSGIAYVPEGGGVFPFMTVLENLQLGAVHLRGSFNDRLDKMFDKFPVLKERRHQQAGTLGGGQRQLAAIARALMSEPRLIMFDEPSLGLAPRVVEELFIMIKELGKEGYTILLSEQNAGKTLQISSRAYVFQIGTVVLNGTSKELMDNSAVRKAYLGG